MAAIDAEKERGKTCYGKHEFLAIGDATKEESGSTAKHSRTNTEGSPTDDTYKLQPALTWAEPDKGSLRGRRSEDWRLVRDMADG